MRENLIKVKSFQFALAAIDLYKGLIAEREFVLSRQFLRAATSIGANAEEAMAAQSRRDFIAKMTISSKEAREANYWLRLLKASNLTRYPLDDLLLRWEEVVKILTAIVKTSQRINS